MHFSPDEVVYDEDDYLEREFEEHMQKQYEEYVEGLHVEETMPDEYVEESLKFRDEAESNGLYDDSRTLTVEQEMTLASAISVLSELSKETNSSLSELLKIGGLPKGN